MRSVCLGIITRISECGVKVSFKDGYIGIWPKELFSDVGVSLKTGEEFFIEEEEGNDFGTIENPKEELGKGFHVSLVNDDIKCAFEQARGRDGLAPYDNRKEKLRIFSVVKIVDTKR